MKKNQLFKMLNRVGFLFLLLVVLTACNRNTDSKLTAPEMGTSISDFNQIPAGKVRVRMYNNNGNLLQDELLAVSNFAAPAGDNVQAVPRSYTYRTPQFWGSGSPEKGWCTVTAYRRTRVEMGGKIYQLNEGDVVEMLSNTFPPGTAIAANNGVQVVCWNNQQHWARGFTLIPYTQAGRSYVMPKLTPSNGKQYVSVVAFRNNSRIMVGGRSIVLNEGQTYLTHLRQGMRITSNYSIACYAHNNEKYWARGATLLPMN